jgi:hypothetical protein
MTLKIMYDTEFLEDGNTIDLISIGMVDELGREFYAVSNEFATGRVAKDKWLMKNVMNSIEHVDIGNDFIITDDRAMSRRQIRDGILEFVGWHSPEWWAWFGAYDHIALCQIFGKMIDLPRGWPMYTNDLVQAARMLKKYDLPKQKAGNHNALDDARFNWERYNYIFDA